LKDLVTRLRERIDTVSDQRDRLERKLDAERKRTKRWYQAAYQRGLQRDVWMRRYDAERALRIQLERRLTLVERDAA
jgi:hypothetical protein